MTEHWTPRNIGVEVPPTKLHTNDPMYDPLIRPTPAQLVALVSDVVTMGHTRKMGVFRPVFETLSTLGLELDGADPVRFLEFPETERDIVIVLGFDCDASTYPSRSAIAISRSATRTSSMPVPTSTSSPSATTTLSTVLSRIAGASTSVCSRIFRAAAHTRSSRAFAYRAMSVGDRSIQ
ncbi:hypothetical protein ACFQE8_22220 [Salinirubellus sp. GCM10025818]|uniref:hypothetical protein n=1 Tax=Salinirubellus TaxID=2162630 RepID=UPI0030D2B6FD